jgi:putative SOS response-associated peptidase YedK
MCGRYSFTIDLDELREAFPEFQPPENPEELGPRYNIAPTQEVPVVANNGRQQIEFFRWGLVPFWADDPGIGNRLINARSETAARKPAFRAAFKRRRCLVLSDGFYEWGTPTGFDRKTPFYVRMESQEPFAFAGLWEMWGQPESPLLTCTILTTDANELVKPIHDRMPVIIPREAYEVWLTPGEIRPGAVNDLLKPYPSEPMTAHPVSRVVNNPRNDVADCIAPIDWP